MKEDKITINTELDTWYGVTKGGQLVAITEIDLMELTSLLANSMDPEMAQTGERLFEESKTNNHITMHDGTILVKTIKEALAHNLIEVSQDLLESAKLQNIKNGFLDPDPFTV